MTSGESEIQIIQKETYGYNYLSGFIEWVLHYIFVSNDLQEFVKSFNMAPAVSAGHFSSLLLLKVRSENNNSFYLLMKTILNILRIPWVNFESQWQLLKYEIHKLTIEYSEKVSVEGKNRRACLELGLKQVTPAWKYCFPYYSP